MYRIAQELVRHSFADGYLVGSRGSVGSSLVAYLSDITEVNSLQGHYICPNCKNVEFIESEIGLSGCDLPDKVCPKCGTKYRKTATIFRLKHSLDLRAIKSLILTF